MGPSRIAATGLFASGPGGFLSLASDFAAAVFWSIGKRRSPTDRVRGDGPKAKPGAYYGIGNCEGDPARPCNAQGPRRARQARLWDVPRNLQRPLQLPAGQMQTSKGVIDLGLRRTMRADVRFRQQDAAAARPWVAGSQRADAIPAPTRWASVIKTQPSREARCRRSHRAATAS